jgi:beta-galactosidase
MEKRRSFCLFVAHGGTNFGFRAGANDAGREDGYQPDLTSYDFGAPIDEQGRPRKEYFLYRDIIFNALGEKPPAVPDEIRAIGFPAIVPRRFANLRSNVGDERAFETPPTFEELGQNQGIVFYRTMLPAGDTATLWFDKIADYAQIWVGGRRVATADRRNGRPFVSVSRRDKPVELEIVVEAMGHINFGKGMLFDKKGIVGEVRLGGVVLKNWRVATLPLTEVSVASAKGSPEDAFAGGHFRATLKLDTVADTYIDMSKWNKGMLYINGHNLGRYWKIGPQLSLYCPAPFLKRGENRIDIVELELSEPQPIRGLAQPVASSSNGNTKNAANEW